MLAQHCQAFDAMSEATTLRIMGIADTNQDFFFKGRILQNRPSPYQLIIRVGIKHKDFGSDFLLHETSVLFILGDSGAVRGRTCQTNITL